MARRFLLMGSGEFEPWSEPVERSALDGRSGQVAVVPTASSAEGDEVFDRWGRMGLEHYDAMGLEARVVPIRSREDAESVDLAAQLESASMVFFSGGKPQHLASAIHGTAAWEALGRALDGGTVYGGCSAGAVVASQMREQRRDRGVKAGLVFGLGLVPHVSFGVHWDKVKVFPGLRTFVMSRIPKGSWFVGLDERTAIVGDGRAWTVHGEGGTMVRHGGETSVFREGESFTTGG